MAKGDYKEECYRKECSQGVATFYNKSTGKHYCEECARMINVHNISHSLRLYETPFLCTEVYSHSHVSDVEEITAATI